MLDITNSRSLEVVKVGTPYSECARTEVGCLSAMKGANAGLGEEIKENPWPIPRYLDWRVR